MADADRARQPQEERHILAFLERPHPFTGAALSIALGGFLKRALALAMNPLMSASITLSNRFFIASPM